MQEIRASDAATEADFRATLEKALADRQPLRLPPSLEAQFEARRGGSRRHKMARALIVVGALCLLSVSLEACVSATLAWHGLPLRIAVSLLCFCGAFMLGGARAPWQEAACAVVPLLGAMAVTQALGQVAPDRVADRYLVVAPMIVAAFVASVPLRLGTAVVMCVAATLCTVGVFLHSTGRLGLAQNWDVVLFTLGVMFIALALARRDEIGRRRGFLLALQHELSARDMTCLNAKLMRLSATDMLTGLANRRQFELELERAWLERPGADLGLALIDVDHFKLFNDSAGHAAGDACLRAVAAAVAATRRGTSPGADRAARYGGEEFVVLMPGAAVEDLSILGDRLRRAVEDLQLPHPGQPGRCVTISVGMAWCAAAGRAGTPDGLLRDADRALYAAKNAGRNRVAVAGDLDIAAE